MGMKKYKIVLYELKNGVSVLEGKEIDYRPDENAVKAAMMLYGARRAEIFEIPSADESTAYGNDCRNGRCDV